MKYIVWLILTVTAVGCSTHNGTTITIEYVGDVPANGQVVLYRLSENSMEPVDTLQAKKEGVFKTEIASGTEQFYRVDFFRAKYVNLVLDGTEGKVNVKIDGETKTVDGSVGSRTINQIDKLLADSQREVQRLNQEAAIAQQQEDVATFQALVDEFNSKQETQIKEIKKLTREALPSIAALYGLNYLDMESNLQFFDSALTVMSEKNADYFWVKGLKENVSKVQTLAVGNVAPDFTLNTPEGEPMSLSDLRGKYVLIDFWAAWCRPCRIENPNVVRMYNTYGGGDNFEILGVSLDRTKEAWLKGIEEDGLVWKHVSDLQYFNSAAAQLYNIEGIPATYLIDPNGIIAAKNLRGPTLEAKLQELFVQQ